MYKYSTSVLILGHLQCSGQFVDTRERIRGSDDLCQDAPSHTKYGFVISLFWVIVVVSSVKLVSRINRTSTHR